MATLYKMTGKGKCIVDVVDNPLCKGFICVQQFHFLRKTIILVEIWIWNIRTGSRLRLLPEIILLFFARWKIGIRTTL